MHSLVHRKVNMKKSKEKAKQIFTDEDIASFVELGGVLWKIHNRLISDGYVFKNGKLSKPVEKV